MREPALLLLLEEVFDLEKSSFIRYVVESSQAELRDDLDRRAFALYEKWCQESIQNQRAVHELLAEEEVVVAQSSYSIDFSQFNYLSPTYLLKHVIRKMGEHLDRLYK